jgi:hypothetical protein
LPKRVDWVLKWALHIFLSTILRPPEFQYQRWSYFEEALLLLFALELLELRCPQFLWTVLLKWIFLKLDYFVVCLSTRQAHNKIFLRKFVQVELFCWLLAIILVKKSLMSFGVNLLILLKPGWDVTSQDVSEGIQLDVLQLQTDVHVVRNADRS